MIMPSPPRPPHPNPRQALGRPSVANPISWGPGFLPRRGGIPPGKTPHPGKVPSLAEVQPGRGPRYVPLNRDSGPWRRRKASCSKTDKLGTSITTRQTTRENRHIQEGPRLSSHAAPGTPSQGTRNGEQTAEPISWGPGCGWDVYAGSTQPFRRVPSLEEVQPQAAPGSP